MTTQPQLPKLFYVTSGLSQNNQTPYGLTVKNNSSMPGTEVTLAQVASPGSASLTGQLWYVQDGRLRSGLGNDLVLSYLPMAPGTALTALNDPLGSAIQQWRYDPQTSQISNLFDPGTLYVVGDSLESSQVAFGSNPDNEGAQWHAWPSYPLQAILAQTPQGFQQFTGDEADAYTCINDANHLNLPITCALGSGQVNAGVRCEYNNLAASLTSYQLDLVTYTAASCGVSQDAFDNVVEQLNTELTDAQNVQNLFAAYTDFFNEVFIANSTQLAQLITDAGYSQNDQTQVEGVAAAVVNGVVYAVLSALGTGEGAVANLMEAGISTVEAAQPGTLTESFQSAVSDLYNNFETRFNALLSGLGTAESIMLTDQSIMHQVAALTQKQGTPDSLYFDSSQDGPRLQAASAGYAVAAMQVLLPGKWNVGRAFGQASCKAVQNFEGSAKWGECLGQAYDGCGTLCPSGLGISYGISNVTSFQVPPRDFPSTAALQGDVFGNGASELDFYNGSNGWQGFNATAYSNLTCTGQLVTVTNYSPNALSVTVSPMSGAVGGNNTGLEIGGSFSPVTQDLAPYGFVQFAGVGRVAPESGNKDILYNDLLLDVSVVDPNASNAEIAAWQAAQSGETNNPSCTSQPATVSAPTTSGGYTASVLKTVDGARALGGLTSVGIYFPITPQPSWTPTIGPSLTPTPPPTATPTISPTPTLRVTPTAAGAANCCQCGGEFSGCFAATETCPLDCTLVLQAACDVTSGACPTFTPTPTPILENVIYVSADTTMASDSYPGTSSNPKLTIQAGINAAHDNGLTGVVRIDGGVYQESLNLIHGISIVGGFNSKAGWIKDSSVETILMGGPTAISGFSVLDLSIMDMTIEAAAAPPTPGASSYGIWLYDATNITISGCTVSSGEGALGVPGLSGAPGGLPGPTATPGTAGCEYPGGACDSCNQPQGGSGANAALCGGGAGGRGGAAGSCISSQTSGGGSMGQAGNAGSGGGAGGQGGTGGQGCSDDNAAAEGGKVGGAGDSGLNGSGGAGFGALGQMYTPANGGDGTDGQPGGGGGGGAGGGGGNKDCDSYGGGGGGGGSGGCGGFHGSGGGGGGGSFPIWIDGFQGQTVSIVNTHLSPSKGGTGGTAGAGGKGGAGGGGGAGGAGEDDSRAGGSGGAGGPGGQGGHGGGGGGGPSVGIVCAGEMSVSCSDLAYASTPPPTAAGGTSVGHGGTPGTVANAYNCSDLRCATPAPPTSTPTPTHTATATAPPVLGWSLNSTPVATPLGVPVGGMAYRDVCPGCPDQTLLLTDTGGRFCSTNYKATVQVDFNGVDNTPPLPIDQDPDPRPDEILIKQIPAAPEPGTYDLQIQLYDCTNGHKRELITMPGAIQYNAGNLTWLLNGTPIPVGTPVRVPIGGQGFANSCPGCLGTLVLQDSGARLCPSSSNHQFNPKVIFGTLSPPVTLYPDESTSQFLVQTLPPAQTPGIYNLQVDTFGDCDNGANGQTLVMENAVEYVAPTVTPTRMPTSTPTPSPVPTQTPTGASTPSATPTPPAPTATAVSTSTPTATAASTPTLTPTPAASGFSWLIDGTPAPLFSGLSTTQSTDFPAPPGPPTLQLVDTATSGRFCFVDTGTPTTIHIGSATGPLVGFFTDTQGSTAQALYIGSFPAQPPGTYDLYVLTTSTPGLCLPTQTSYVMPGAVSYGP